MTDEEKKECVKRINQLIDDIKNMPVIAPYKPTKIPASIKAGQKRLKDEHNFWRKMDKKNNQTSSDGVVVSVLKSFF